MARFVLVHGAWLGGWSFEPLTRELRARGHRVDTPDLPCEDVSKSLADYARVIGDCRDAVLVAHSLGGLTAALVEARAHVYVSALLPDEDVFRVALLESFTGSIRDTEGRSHWPDLETAAAKLFPDCTRKQAEWAFARLRPQARVHVVPAPVRGVYVACLRDAAIRPDWQLSATGRGLDVLELHAGHFPMLTHPRELADLLGDVDRRTRG
jgi:pimeloyl-ACP methyl ester carboxylesterase